MRIAGKDITIDKTNADVARRIFGTWIAKVIRGEGIDSSDVALVPIPSSDAVRGSVNRNAEMISSSIGGRGLDVVDILRLDTRLEKASAGGPRFADQLYPHLVVDGILPKRKKIVLVDDIVTSGGHMKAARARISEAGGTVVFGIAFGRTVHSTKFDPLAAGAIDVDDSISFFDQLSFD